ncbi:hypothetical protein ST201phi2-1p399 [Pseudomonas phage 201phi2-1]|uniref:Uncharacterized protein n=1 Tax=Pseudomonas phage 201phi2-1 TaxID=198110 RepID=B3FJQ8_BP201|nr:hypothetical protein ST201phi2-1p399 [Pseudomonas phage 201phi2-1]ABY63223.1 hypothetical protein 201phi2-1p399 [Pseudomonas phage 201phi2-1]
MLSDDAWDKLCDELKKNPIPAVRVATFPQRDAPMVMTDKCSGIYPIRELKKDRK